MTDEHIHELSQRLYERGEITKLGLKLKISLTKIDAFFTFTNDNRSATYQILRALRQRQDPLTAYKTLGEALIEAKLNRLAIEVLDYPITQLTPGLQA